MTKIVVVVYYLVTLLIGLTRRYKNRLKAKLNAKVDDSVYLEGLENLIGCYHVSFFVF